MKIYKQLLTAVMCLSLGSYAAAQANEPSVLEIRQMQTRIFQAPPAKLHEAVIEFCQNLGGTIAKVPWGGLPEHNCMNARWRGKTIFLKYTLTQEGAASTLIRLRLNIFDPMPAVSLNPTEYEFVYKSLGDLLVLNEVGIEVKVFK